MKKDKKEDTLKTPQEETQPKGLPISKKEPIAMAIHSMTFNTLNARSS